MAGTCVAGLSSGLTCSVSPGSGQVFAGNGSYTGFFGGGGGGGAITGSITTTFTWVPAYTGEEPPKSTIAVESVTLAAEAKSYPVGGVTATGNSGLPESVENVEEGNLYVSGVLIGWGRKSTVSQVAPSVRGGGQTVTVTCSPSVSAGSGAGPFSGNLSYSVELFPVEVSLSGTVIESDQHFALPGHQISASLSCAAPLIEIGPYTWEIPGSKFGNFVVGEGQETGSVEPFDATELASQAPTWRWLDDPGAKLIKGRANVRFLGIEIGEITGEKTCNLESPIGQFLNIKRLPLNATDTGSLVTNPDGSLEIVSGTPVPLLMTFSGKTPTKFVSGNLSGSVGLAQLVKVTVKADGATVSPPSFTDFRLDNNYPYRNGWQPATSSTHFEEDQPRYGFSTGQASSVALEFKYEVTLMYLGPSPTAAAVPLLKGTWSWSASASKDTQGQWVYGGGVINVSGAGVKTSAHPTWSHRALGTGS